jgi:chaperone modulatory protein CbpM
VQRILVLERDFEAIPELAALVADLQEEIETLRKQLLRAGLE